MAKQRRLMQEALDDNLEPEALQDLHRQLETDRREADHFDQLQRVDRMLRTAPTERAPQRMAMAIMSRLAEAVSPEQLSRLSGLALVVGLALVTVILVPLLVTAGWLLLSGLGSAAALTGAIQVMVGLLAAAMTLVESVSVSVEMFLSENPAVPVFMIALIPLTLYLLWRVLPRREAPLE